MLWSCASREEVIRRRGEWIQSGRRVSPLAYAWYARGSHHESKGEFSDAARNYREALGHDPKSGSAWAALGRVLCRTRAEEAQRAFERGLRTADRRAPIYMERGACRLTLAGGDQRRVLKACSDFALAMDLEPHAPQISARYSSCLRISGRELEAERHERAARLFFGVQAASSPEPTLEEVDRALLSGDLKRAQDLSLELMSPGTLAARAVLLGQSRLAREQAEFVLLASPGDADASAALLALGADLPSSTETLRGLSAPGLLLLFLALKREANSKVAHQFLSQHSAELEHSSDPLVAEALQELRDAK